MIRREDLNMMIKTFQRFIVDELCSTSSKIKEHKDRVYIAMPPQIATSYTPAFRRADIGVGGVAALGMMAAGDDFTEMAKSLQSGAKAAIPEFSTAAVLSMINATNQFVGLQGQLDLNSSKTYNRVKFLTISEQIFQGVGFKRITLHSSSMLAQEKNLRRLEELLTISRLVHCLEFDLVNLMKSSSTMLQNLINQVRKTSKESNLAKISTVRKIMRHF